MHDGEIDGILSAEERIAPSAGFASRVMTTIRREVSEPAPIAFPWRRALPLILTWAAAMITLIVEGRSGPSAPPLPASSGLITAAIGIVKDANNYGVGWILLSLALPAISVMLSMRLVQRRSV